MNSLTVSMNCGKPDIKTAARQIRKAMT